MDKKKIVFVSVVSVIALSMMMSAPTVSASDNNYVTENELEDIEDNLRGDLHRISDNLSGLLDDYNNFKDESATEDFVNEKIDTLSNKMDSQFDHISNQLSEMEEEEEEGQGLILISFQEGEMQFLTFGGMSGSGSMNPMMLMMNSGDDGGQSSMFNPKEVSSDTPVMIMNNSFERVKDASIEAFARGDNGLNRVDVPVMDGITFFPIKGSVFGSVNAPNYDSSSFYLTVGEGTGGTGEDDSDSGYRTISTNTPLKPGESQVIKIAKDGDVVELDSIDVEGPADSVEPNPEAGYIRFVPNEYGTYNVLFSVNDQSYEESIYVEEPESDVGQLEQYIIGIALIALGVFVIYYKRDRLIDIVKRDSSSGSVSDEDIWEN